MKQCVSSGFWESSVDCGDNYDVTMLNIYVTTVTVCVRWAPQNAPIIAWFANK